MSPKASEQAIISSAVVVGGLYAYMRFRGKTTTPFSTFATAFGTVFFVLSLAAQAAPGAAGAFAILVATADVLANGQTLATQAIAAATPPAGTHGITPTPAAGTHAPAPGKVRG